MMFKRLFIALFLVSGFARMLPAQDPEFSQFYANPLYLNPAMAGITVNPKVNANYRNQWPAIGKAYITYAGSYDQYLKFLHGGIGISIMADRAGSGNLNTTAISLMYSYIFNLSAHLQASGALKFGYYQRNLNWSNLKFGDQIDPLNGFVYQTQEPQPPSLTVGVPDFSTGIFLAYDDILYGGIAVDHLTQPKVGFYATNNTKLYMKYTIHAGGTINLHQSGSSGENREFSLSPNVLYQQQFNFHQLNLGMYLTVDPFIGGIWFRYNFENADAIIPMIGLHYKNLRVGYSYDITVSKLRTVSGGAHEVSASWQFDIPEKRRHIRAIKCPRF